MRTGRGKIVYSKRKYKIIPVIVFLPIFFIFILSTGNIVYSQERAGNSSVKSGASSDVSNYSSENQTGIKKTLPQSSGGSGDREIKSATGEKSYPGSSAVSSGDKNGGETSSAKKSISGTEAVGGSETGVSDQPVEAGTQRQPAGEDPYQYEEPKFDQRAISYPLLVLRTIAILAVIIIGIYFIFRLLLKAKGKVISDTDIIRVLATYPLSPNRVIQIVEIAEKILVLGVTESNINLIMSVDDKEYADRIKLLSSKEKAEGKGFKEQFMRFIGGSGGVRGGKISYLNNYKERIKKMKKF